MPKIRDDVVRAVLDRARIEDVVGDFVTLRRAGVNMTGICPFHDDKHDGNFIVRPSTISEKNHGNTYRCFVCDKKGGPVQFLMDAERMTFPDAIRWLGKKYCVDVDDVCLWFCGNLCALWHMGSRNICLWSLYCLCGIDWNPGFSAQKLSQSSDMA